MLFNSLTFLAFLAAVLVAVRLPIGWASKKVVLAVCSWTFYAAAEPALVVLLLGSTVLNWRLGLWIERSLQERTRRRLLLVGLVGNLSVLVAFKHL